MGSKLKLIISDLHIGVGAELGSQYGSERNQTSDQFVKFLHTTLKESNRDSREVELIINGDFLALLQVPAVVHYQPHTRYPLETYRDSSQEASIKRLEVIVDTNPDIFNALSDFIQAEQPQRRITIIKGNHDVSLFWPGVKNRLREVLGASGLRASLLRFADEFVSREKIYVEHGHQRAEKMNGYHDSFDPRTLHDPTQLHYPAGSRFTIDFLNQARQNWWFVDRIKPVTTLIWYAFRWNFDFACQALASFIRHTPALVVADFEMGRNLPPSTESFLSMLENPDQRQKLAQGYLVDSSLRLAFNRQVQQYLDDATVDNKGEANLPFIDVADNPLHMGQADQQRQRLMLRQAAQKIAEEEGARVVVFGHTHSPVQELLPSGRMYINTGSWQQDLSDASPETWRKLFAGQAEPVDAGNRFPYARVEYDDQDNPTASLCYFDG